MRRQNTLRITTETYTRTASGKSWRAVPDTVSVETMPWTSTAGDAGEDWHRRVTHRDTLRFFRSLGGSEYAVRSYTSVGYIVTRLVSTNPSRTVRKVRRFDIVSGEGN